ncbi:MAG: anhydro-N-acetylmuramic acid kinase [Nitrosomonas sp.]|nr:anhydro-N-acetylmuramic acid kinase [Nitrosomonas sp.]
MPLSSSYYIGLMSGTSLDGIDAALTDFSRSPALIETAFASFDHARRADLLALSAPGKNELQRAAILANQLTYSYAEIISQLLDQAMIAPSEIRAIGCHGQTIRHCPQAGFSIQLINGALLAELTGITVITDFRSRDIAAGGQGAPLVPAFHQAVFAHPEINRLIINIGGIANITNLPVTGDVTGFDCGPGNMLMDAWCYQHTGMTYDHDGNWANSGNSIPRLLEKLLASPYLACTPPKSTGRELFHLGWLTTLLSGSERPEDIQATLLRFTVETIGRAVMTWHAATEKLYLCGGGAHNPALVALLRETLPRHTIELTDMLGVPADWVEACAFAWLAQRTIDGLPGNLPAVTGASGARILGATYHL